MFHPSRGGVRGGQDQFSWDNVKEDKYRENYLGHSLKAPVGRWQKGKDLTWYAKNAKEKDEARAAELKAIKEAEEEAMLEALGYPVKKKTNSGLIDPKELNSILQKGPHAGEEETEKEDFDIKGLGYKDEASKSLTGKIESTKFTSSSSFPANMSSVSSKQKCVLEDTEAIQDHNTESSPKNSSKKRKDKKSKKPKSKSKSKKKRYDSDIDEDLKPGRLSSSQNNTAGKKRHDLSFERSSRHLKEGASERDHFSRRSRVSDFSSRRRSRSPRREGNDHRNSTRY